MDMGLALRIAHPFEGAVREGDFQPVAIEQQGPELRDLLALRDRIRGDKTNAGPLGTTALTLRSLRSKRLEGRGPCRFAPPQDEGGVAHQIEHIHRP
jgi:hypothetical protein